MAEKSGNGRGQARPATPAAGTAAPQTPKVSWDDSALRSSYANVCNVSSTREEVVLVFGVNQTWQNTENEVKVQLSDRVILSPYAAKRLSLLLQNVMTQYEQRFGTLDIAVQQRGRTEASS